MILVLSVGTIQASDVNSTEIGIDEDNALLDEDPLDNMSSSLNEVSLTESAKNQTELSSPTESVYYSGSFSVTLRDSNATLSNRTVHFSVNDVVYDAVSDINGVASLNLKLNPGKYSIFSYFDGDDDYDACNLTSQLNVLPTIKASDITKYYKGSTQYTATFLDGLGHALANRAVTILVNGKKYTKNTNSKGVVSLPVNLKPGTYRIVATDPITGYQLTTNFNILPTITSATKLKKVEGETFKVKFLKANGKALAKKYVKIKFRGKTYKLKTNANGIATLSLKKVKKGSYNVVCRNNDGLSKTFKINVYQRKASTKLTSKDYTFLPDEKRVIKVKLTTALDDTSNVGKVIKIRINGKTYSKKTDGDGVASLDLSSFKKGIYNVQYSYDGSKYFKASKSTKSVKIFDTTNTRLTVKSTIRFGYGAGTSLKVAYTAGGVPLAKKTVKLVINGKTYSKTTDANGIVAVPINLAIGSYNVTYNANGDLVFSPASGSCEIDVFQRGPSKVLWKCGNSYKDNSQTFKVLVTDSKGKATSGGMAELTIDGETYTAAVGSDGYAKFRTDVAIGKYNVKVKFNGNNDLLTSSNSKTVNVKLSKFGNGINQKNAKGSSAYLKSSSHCKVGSKAIKKLVKSLTKGLTSKVDKAKAIFNYVRDTLDYSYYYNSKYGASGTLKHKKGNCVDHSHLLVAMFRTAGFNARYVHGRCHFGDGDTTGHVWTQVKIGSKWVCADATSYRNSLGKIRNWNTNSYTLHAKYASLPF